MVLGFTILLLCQLVGEALARGFGLPVPGPVLGLVLLVAALHVAHRFPRSRDVQLETMSVTRVADGLLANLSLLFVPAGVGVIDQIGVLRAEALPLAVALIVSTAVTLLTTVLVFVGIKRMLARRAAPAS